MSSGRDEIGLDEIKARARAAEALYLADPKPFAGVVERPKPKRQQSVVPKRCSNPACREWPPIGSRAAGICLLCETPL